MEHLFLVNLVQIAFDLKLKNIVVMLRLVHKLCTEHVKFLTEFSFPKSNHAAKLRRRS